MLSLKQIKALKVDQVVWVVAQSAGGLEPSRPKRLQVKTPWKDAVGIEFQGALEPVTYRPQNFKEDGSWKTNMVTMRLYRNEPKT